MSLSAEPAGRKHRGPQAKTAPARAQVVRHSPRKRCRPEGRKRNRTCDFPVVRTRAGTEIQDPKVEGQGVSPGLGAESAQVIKDDPQ